MCRRGCSSPLPPLSVCNWATEGTIDFFIVAGVGPADHSGMPVAGGHRAGGGPGAADAERRRRRPPLHFPRGRLRLTTIRINYDGCEVLLYALSRKKDHRRGPAPAPRRREQHRRACTEKGHAGNPFFLGSLVRFFFGFVLLVFFSI